MLDQLATQLTKLALHSGDPGAADTASNELTGGSPAYARKTVAFNAAGTPTTGGMTTNGDVVFDVPASTVAWVSGWNTGGTQRFFKKQVTSEVFGAQGTYTVLSGSLFDLLNDP
jgi:hypothetical protein